MNLICVEDGIDSSKDAGKLMISVLSAVAIRRIIQNPVYSGKISYGRSRTEKVHLLSGILKCPVYGAGMYGNGRWFDKD